MFGSHLSVAGGLHLALARARELGMSCVQIFTKNQRQWRVPPLKEEQIEQWRLHRRRTRLGQVVSHDSYLINLAGPTGPNRRRSVALFRDELLRCAALEIPWLVTHPGAHLGGGEAAGLKRVASALNRLHRDLGGLEVVTCLEVMAGQGTALGHRLAHLRRIIDLAHEPQRLAVCLDTAHLLAAGYDLTSAAGCRAVLDEVDDVLGLDMVRVWHLNDSKSAPGSRVDRHEHIGRGHVSPGAFRVIVNHPQFRNVPKVLETAKEDAPDGRPWDAINLEKLRSLVARGSAGRRSAGPSARKTKARA